MGRMNVATTFLRQFLELTVRCAYFRGISSEKKKQLERVETASPQRIPQKRRFPREMELKGLSV